MSHTNPQVSTVTSESVSARAAAMAADANNPSERAALLTIALGAPYHTPEFFSCILERFHKMGELNNAMRSWTAVMNVGTGLLGTLQAMRSERMIKSSKIEGQVWEVAGDQAKKKLKKEIDMLATRCSTVRNEVAEVREESIQLNGKLDALEAELEEITRAGKQKFGKMYPDLDLKVEGQDARGT